MIRRRDKNTGLPWRVYERFGKRWWRIWYQPPKGKRITLFECQAGDVTRAQARANAKIAYQVKFAGTPEAIPEVLTFRRLGEQYFAWQAGLPGTDDQKKAASTIEGNAIEFKTLCKKMGDSDADAITAGDWYKYQDWRRKAGCGPKANKELALASAIMEYGRMRELIPENTARIKRVKTRPLQRRVTLAEVDAALVIARTMGPGATIQVLCARAALLCLRRPDEIRRMKTSQIGPDGIEFEAGKRKAGETVLTTTIEWSPQLKQTIDDVQQIERKVDISPYVFGTLEGSVYTKSGWGASWRRLMAKCAKKIPGFQSFTLRDCRPGGVTSKKERGDHDTQDATMHRDSRMIETIYDRRRSRRAKPAH